MNSAGQRLAFAENIAILKAIAKQLKRGAFYMKIWKLDCDVDHYENLANCGYFDLDLISNFKITKLFILLFFTIIFN